MFTDQINTTDKIAGLLDRLSVSPGLITVRPPHILFGNQYIFGMYVPRPEWRTLSAVEADSMSRKGLLQEISLVRLEPAVLAALRTASGAIELSVLESPDGTMRRGVIPHALGQRVLEHLLGENIHEAQLVSSLLRQVEPATHSDVEEDTGTVPHGSTTFYPNSDKAIGLHLDTWAHKRDFMQGGRPFRCIVNIGWEPRYVAFVNAAPDEISQMILDANPSMEAAKLLEDNPQEWAQRFMSAKGDHPVMRLKILPGEAYIMDTHACIHDGWAVDRTSADIFVILSYIRDAA